MTPTPEPDVRELAIRIFAEHVFANSMACVCGHEPATSSDWDGHAVDAVLAAVTPVIRRQALAEAMKEAARRWQSLADDPEWLDEWLSTHRLHGAGPGLVVAAVAADYRAFATNDPVAIARSHSQPTEEETTNEQG